MFADAPGSRGQRPAQIVLIGGGHTHAEIIRRWGLAPIPNTELTCVSDAACATYSGMLPGVLAGQYGPDAMRIDLERLCARAGVRLVLGEVHGFDATAQYLVVGTTRLQFDAASVGIGSRPSTEGVDIGADAPIVPIKPMRSFLDRLDAQIAAAGARPTHRVAVVGGGAGGIEIAFALQPRLQSLVPAGTRIDIALVTGPDGPTPAQSPRTTRRVVDTLHRKGIDIVRALVTRVTSRSLEFAEAPAREIDIVVWATGAAAPPLLRMLGLPTDERGFLRTSDTLRTIGDAPVFAVGDSGTIDGHTVPKAGVYAVRQAPILWDNLHRILRGASLAQYRPQPSFLRLLNTGDGRAIGEWRGVSFEGMWAWRLKDHIDRRFMARYHGR